MSDYRLEAVTVEPDATSDLEHVNKYIDLIGQLLPYPQDIKSDALNELKQDVVEAWFDLASSYPDVEARYQQLIRTFGSPDEVAKNICRANEWHHHRAGFSLRALAYLVDAMLSFTLGLLPILPLYVLRAVEESSDLPTFAFRLLILLTFGTMSPLIVIGYFVLLEGRFGTTVGKRLFGLGVVAESGIKISWQQAIVRNFTKMRFELLLLDFLIGTFVMKLERQRAMDKLAETIVIRMNSSKREKKGK